MERTTSSTPRTAPVGAVGLLAVAVIAAGIAAFLVLERIERGAAAAVAACSVALALGGLLAAEKGSARSAIAMSITGRVADGAIFGPLAWVLLADSVRAGAAALVALSTSYVASYLRVKAAGLGFRMREALFVQPIGMVALAAGLLTGGVEAGLWAAAAVGLLAAVGAVAEVSRQEEPA